MSAPKVARFGSLRPLVAIAAAFPPVIGSTRAQGIATRRRPANVNVAPLCGCGDCLACELGLMRARRSRPSTWTAPSALREGVRHV